MSRDATKVARVPLGLVVGPWKTPLLLAALIVMLDQILQMWATAGPVDWSVPISRFQAAALFSGRIAAFAVASLLVLVASEAAGGARWRRILALVSLALAVLFVVSFVILWADGPSVKTSVPGNATNVFLAEWIRGMIVCVAGAPCFAALGIGLLRYR